MQQSPTRYRAGNGMQRDIYQRLLPDLLAKLSWSPGLKVLDIGCGDGQALTEFLVPSLPGHGAVLGVDKAEPMVEFARNNYATDQIRFLQADIGSPNAVDEIGGKFDRIFSLLCLHWVQDQKQVLKNIEALLAPGGEAILLFVGESTFFKVFEKMATSSPWQEQMQDWTEFVSPYRRAADPAVQFRQLAERAALHVLHVAAPWHKFDYDTLVQLESSLSAITPFLERIPVGERPAFLRRCVEEMVQVAPPEGEGVCTLLHQLIIARVPKAADYVAE